ncbi:MAG: helix-turn-helix domain-containing protein [Gemmatimonadota bacterium]
MSVATVALPLPRPAPEPVPAGPDTLAGVLQAFRAARGLSIRAAGGMVGGSRGVWAKWESGVVPSPVYLRRIAGLLGLSGAEARQLAGPDRVRRPGSAGDEESPGLAQARLRAGLSAAEFARRLHVSAALVSRWEGGERVPGRSYFPAIAQALGTGTGFVEELFRHRAAAGESAPVPGLRAVRLRRGLTRAQLASSLQVDVTTIQRWERQGRAPYRQAMALAAALGADLAALARPLAVAPPPKPAGTPLRRLRQQRDLSPGVVAARAGVPCSSLDAWERGASRPSWAQARALARALSVPVAQVFAAAGLESPRHLDPARWAPECLPAVLAELRRWQGWTQQDLAVLLGVSSTTIRAWEKGRQRPRAGALDRLDRHVRSPVRMSTLLGQGPAARARPGG